MLNMKKVLIACTVLTALSTSALAADSEHKPSMHDRVNKIMHEDSADFHKAPEQGKHNRFDKEHKRPPMSAEQRAEMEKKRKEQHDKYAKETMSKLTAEQKAEVEAFIKEGMEQRQARHEKLKNMTSEQREAVRANRPMPKPGKNCGPKDGMHRPSHRPDAPFGDHGPKDGMHRPDHRPDGPDGRHPGEHGPRPDFSGIAD
jgi:gas vesicle protein